MTILDQIAAHRRVEIDQLKREVPLESFSNDLKNVPPPRFKSALAREDAVKIIAEIKKGSPSKGILCPDLDPADLARDYARGGAAALSVLTESTHFFGSYDNLKQVRAACELPILCKDFVVDDYQLSHAKQIGADAVLLIVALHTPEELFRRLNLARDIGVDCLVEVHDETELDVALEAGAEIVGVNNRNLKDFSVDLETSERLALHIPDQVIRVSESGVSSADDVSRLKRAGYSCFLIGEKLVTSADPRDKLKELMSV